MPGRSLNPTDFSFAYQGKEKAKDASRWDQFDLRLFNHDLGRWFAPDPYREFSSAYIGMADNPVNATDPNGGQIKYMRSYGLQAQGASAGWNAFHEGLAAEAKMAAAARDLAEMNSYKTVMSGVRAKIIAHMATPYDIILFNQASYNLTGYYMRHNISTQDDYVNAKMTHKEVMSRTGSGIDDRWLDQYIRMGAAERHDWAVATGIGVWDRYYVTQNGFRTSWHNTFGEAMAQTQVNFEKAVKDVAVTYIDPNPSPSDVVADANNSYKPPLKASNLWDALKAMGAGYGISYDVTVSADEHTLFVGGSLGGVYTNFMQMGGDYGGYWYTYQNQKLVGSFNVGPGLMVGYSAGLNFSICILKGTKPDYTPEGFAGQFSSYGISASVRAVAGLSAGGAISTKPFLSNPKSYWVGYSGGAAFGGGFGVTLPLIKIGGGNMRLIDPNNVMPTINRSANDFYWNWAYKGTQLNFIFNDN
jgi:RHS repeat-associated protein